MISVSNVTLAYGRRVTFKEVNIKFTQGTVTASSAPTPSSWTS